MTLTGQGVISDAIAGTITNAVTAIAQILVLLAPIIAGVLIRQRVTPVAAPQLPSGTNVAVTTADGKDVTRTVAV
jgi:hypothetical protein